MWEYNNIEELVKEAIIKNKLENELNRLVGEGKEAKDLDKVLSVYKELSYYLDISKTERYLKEEDISKLVVTSKMMVKGLKEKIKKLIDKRDYDREFIQKLRDSGLAVEDILEVTHIGLNNFKDLMNGKKESIRPKYENRKEFNWIDALVSGENAISERERDDLLGFLSGFWEQDRMKYLNLEDNQRWAEDQLFVDRQSNINLVDALKKMPNNKEREAYLGAALIRKYKDYASYLQRKQNISLEESKKMKEDRESGKAKSYAPVEEMSTENNLFSPGKSFEDELIEPEEDTYEDDMRRLDEKKKKSSFNYNNIDDLIREAGSAPIEIVGQFFNDFVFHLIHEVLVRDDIENYKSELKNEFDSIFNNYIRYIKDTYNKVINPTAEKKRLESDFKPIILSHRFEDAQSDKDINAVLNVLKFILYN